MDVCTQQHYHIAFYSYVITWNEFVDWLLMLNTASGRERQESY